MSQVRLLICAVLLALVPSVHAELTVEGTRPSLSLDKIRIHHAYVLDRQTQKVICQIPTSGRPELVPGRLAAPENGQFPSLHEPICHGEHLELLSQVAQQASPVLKTALILPIGPVLAWVCGVGFISGVNAALAYEASQREHAMDFPMYKDTLATGSLGGAGGGGGVVLASELWAGAHFTWPLAVTGAAGAGLVCGAIGGTSAFLVLYLFDL